MPEKNTERMRYAMPKSAKAARETYAKKLIENLRGENDTFQKNCASLDGPLYNGMTNTVYSGEKQLAILAMAKSHDGQPITDQRFYTFEQARSIGAHVERGSKEIPMEYWAPMKDKETGEVVLLATKRGIYNARDVSGLPAEERSFKYDTAEKVRALDNLASRMKQSIKSINKAEEKAGRPITELPEKGMMNRETYYQEMMAIAAKNTANFRGYNNELDPITPYVDKSGNTKERGGEYLKIDDAHSARQAESPDIAEMRRNFRAYLSVSCLSQEMGLGTIPRESFISREQAHQLAKVFEEHPEKLFHDLKAAGKTVEDVRDNVIFKQRERIPEKEITPELQEAIQKDYRKAFRLKDIDVERKDKAIQELPARNSKYEKMQIKTAVEKAVGRIDNMTKSIQSMKDNELIVNKTLIDKIAETRKKLGREADPQKFTSGYREINNPGRDKEVLINVNSARIRAENMTHEQIINTFANGEERDDILKTVRENVGKEAKSHTQKLLRDRAAERSHEKAQTKARQKGLVRSSQRSRGGQTMERS